jgi:hypothetical protein
MKRFLPTILIVITLLQLLAPLTVGLDEKNNVGIQNNKAEAADSIEVKVKAEANDKNITLYATATFEQINWQTSDEGVFAIIMKKVGDEEIILMTSPMVAHPSTDPEVAGKMTDVNGFILKKVFTGLYPETTYYIRVIAGHNVLTWGTIFHNGAVISKTIIPETGIITDIFIDGDKLEGAEWSSTTYAYPDPLAITTSVAGQTQNVSAGEMVAKNEESMLPNCEWASASTWGGCVGRLIYWTLFKPTSYIFGLTGRLLDVTVDYSIKDTSYHTPFVAEGWGVVRDLCNMFFIFVLLYIAFGTILNLHSVKTKEMIINIVIIGLLINFSLFATQVIIDASNILTRVFYNSETIKIGPKVNGVIQEERGSLGEIKLSEALVSKINPQKLLLQAERVDNIKTKQTITSNEKEANGISATTFILVALLASIVNIVGLITFLSASLIFISRVVGLWMAMIFAPLAFFSYTVPALQDMEMVGWKKWWPETLKLAFLAPAFVFFLYLIIKFLNTGLGLAISDDATGLDFILGIFIPFIFIMILLTKAKDIAKDMSGKMGQSITNGVAAVGAIALGGAALGAAALGRGTIGAMSKYTQNDGARQNALKFKGVTDQWSQMNKLNPFSYLKLAGRGISGLGKAAAAAPAAGFAQIGKKTDPHTGKTTNAFQRETAKLADKEHASHILDEKAQSVTGNKEAKYKDLTEDEQKKVHNVIDRDIASKEQYNKVYDKLDSTQRAALDGYRNPADPRGDWAGAAEMNKTIAAGRGEHIHTAEELSKNSKEPIAVSEFVNALRKGSYDIRNISKLQTSSKGLAKAGIGLTALVASGVRLGLKKGVGVDYGSGQKDLFKDLGNVISESLKEIKIDVPKAPPSGGGHSGGDAHGGGGHH